MNYKLQKVLKDSKKPLVIITILWVILTVALVSPIAYSIVNAKSSGTFYFGVFIQELIPAVASLSTIGSMFRADYIGTFGNCLFYFTFIYIIFALIGFLKTKPKGEYANIEHGSSDWSENGEQYRILNKDKGIVLAQDNYLPVDKRGNVNVLVVGRFWIRKISFLFYSKCMPNARLICFYRSKRRAI